MARRYPLCVFPTALLALAAVLLSRPTAAAATTVIPSRSLYLARHSSRTGGATTSTRDPSAEAQAAAAAAAAAVVAESSVWRHGQRAGAPFLPGLGSGGGRPRAHGDGLGSRRRGAWGLIAVSMY